jgi:hypothetical protein
MSLYRDTVLAGSIGWPGVLPSTKVSAAPGSYATVVSQIGSVGKWCAVDADTRRQRPAKALGEPST